MPIVLTRSAVELVAVVRHYHRDYQFFAASTPRLDAPII